ncbi:unnamed protein product [Gongylonema pulchrum]|uniref:SAM_MT_RSMB_NOP domain-containing protein n=1 Tax=Gongylonema pulchrum TaxID=637853 RepID=A0A183CXA4_9BILA|nr:unnamed protein product [Gongylonema pulchrum]
MVYSTCSLNPVEDEAVIASLLRSADGALELVDVSEQLPELKRKPGLSNKFEDIDSEQRRSFTSSMFPPNEEEMQKFHLERCFRVLPHMQDTGGFFIAVLKKTKALNDNQLKQAFRMPPVKRRKTFKEDPFVFLEKDDARWKDIASYYGISEAFPYENLLGRTIEIDKKRTLYFVNSAVKRFLLDNQDKVKVINAGIRMFGRVENKFNLCRFRMAQDGVRTILPFMEKRVVEIDVEDMCNILKTDNGNENFPREKLKCDQKLNGICAGSIVLVTEFNSVKQVICAWLGAKSLAPYVSKEERIHALRLLGCDTSDFEKVMWTKRQSKALRNREEAEKRRNLEQADIATTEETNLVSTSTAELDGKMVVEEQSAEDEVSSGGK